MTQRSSLETDRTQAISTPRRSRLRRERRGIAPLVPVLERVLEQDSDALLDAPCDSVDGVRQSDAAVDTRAQARPAAGRIKAKRSVETLFRNAYRSQLDLLALAATKANIMISLNGLLMSMLIISGTHFVSVDALYIFPLAIFLCTCALATVFAVLAARPDISKKRFQQGDFENDTAHLLVFEEFSDLDEGQYIDAMSTMLGDRQRVYRNT